MSTDTTVNRAWRFHVMQTLAATRAVLERKDIDTDAVATLLQGAHGRGLIEHATASYERNATNYFVQTVMNAMTSKRAVHMRQEVDHLRDQIDRVLGTTRAR